MQYPYLLRAVFVSLFLLVHTFARGQFTDLTITGDETILNFDLTSMELPPPYQSISLGTVFSPSNPLDSTDVLIINVYGGADGAELIQVRNPTAFILEFRDGLSYMSETANPIFDAMLDGVFSFGLIMNSGTLLVDKFLACGNKDGQSTADCYGIMVDTTSTSIDELLLDGITLPVNLEQNYPNPFRPQTTIPYTLLRSEHVRLEVFDMLGRKVRTLVEKTLAPGQYQAMLNASDLPGGMYIYRLSAGSTVESKVLTLLK